MTPDDHNQWGKSSDGEWGPFHMTKVKHQKENRD